MNLQITTDQRLLDFANYAMLDGWYFDHTGQYRFLMGSYLFSIFVNDCDQTLDITVDTLSDRGVFEDNLEWETPEDWDGMVETAHRFTLQYAVRAYKKW